MTMVALAQDLAGQLAAAPAVGPRIHAPSAAGADLGIPHHAETEAQREPDKALA
jgi:hypothetical protein